jgi:NTE family protein
MSAPRLADVRFEGLTWVNPEFLRTKTQLRAGDAADVAAISADVVSLSALDEIDGVPYRLEGERGSPTLVLSPTESSVGRHVLRPGMGIYASGAGDLKFQVGLQYVQRWMNARGAQWRNQLRLGYETLLNSSFYQPMDVAQRFFAEPGLFVSRTAEDVFVDGQRIAAYSFRDRGGRLDFGWSVDPNMQLRVGYWASDRRSKVVTGGPLLPEIEARDAGIVASAIYDSRDQPGFSRKGFAAQLEYLNIADGFGADRDWERIEAGVRFAVPWQDDVISLTAAGGVDLGEQLPPDRAFTLGGERTLPSFQVDELRAREYWLVRADFLWRLVDLNPVKDQALYVGVGLQGAGVYHRVDRIDDSEFLGASAFLAGPTPIGTVTLGVGYAQNSGAFWLSIGRPIGKGSILDNDMLR